MKAWLRSTLFYSLGVIISTLCAIVLAKLYAGTEWKVEGPLLFAITLVILASHFGATISVAGALLGAAMFAFFLYNPENSFRIHSEAERSTLAWMILASIALSYLLYPTGSVVPGVPAREVDGRTNSDAAATGNSARMGTGHEIAKAPPLSGGREIGAGYGVSNGRTGGEGRG